jgi:hypothetical protein
VTDREIERMVGSNYKYASYFEPSSIHIFNDPIDRERMRVVIPGFQFANRSKDMTDKTEINTLFSVMEHSDPVQAIQFIETGDFDDPDVQVSDGFYEDQPEKPLWVTKKSGAGYGRNRVRAAKVLKRANYQCEAEECSGHYFTPTSTNARGQEHRSYRVRLNSGFFVLWIHFLVL